MKETWRVPNAGCFLVGLLGCLLVPIQVSAAPAAGSATGREMSQDMAVEHGKINTAAASPVDPGHYEIEPTFTSTWATRYWNGSGDSQSRGRLRAQKLGLSVTSGVVEDIDITVRGGYSWLKDNENDFDVNDNVMGPSTGNNFSDLAVSGRYRLYKDRQRHLEIAYIAGLTIPTGSSSDWDEIGTSQEFWSIDQKLVATRDWGYWTINGDIGVTLPIGDKRENHRGLITADLALGYQILPWLQPEVELNYGQNCLRDEADARALAVTAGVVMPLNHSLRVNLGVQQAVWGENADKSTTLLAAVKFAY